MAYSLEELNNMLKFVKAKTGRTNKEMAKSYGYSVSHYNKVKSGKSKSQPFFDKIKRSYKSQKKHYFMLVTVVRQSKLIHGDKYLLLTEKAVIKMINKIEERELFEEFLFRKVYHQGTKDRFKIEDWRRIAETDFGEGIFINRDEFLGELLLQLNKKEQKLAIEEIEDYYTPED